MSDIDVINVIEKHLSTTLSIVELDEVMSANSRCSYVLNESQQVVGLNLQNCKLDNINFIKGLKHLSKLNLSLNQIKKIASLKSLDSLTELNLQKNAIDDITPLARLNQLQKLNLQANQITETQSLKKLHQLISLNLSSNQINQLDSFEDLTKLKLLNLSDNKLDSLTPLKSLFQLIELDLRFNQLKNLDGIEGFSVLVKLFVSSNQLNDINAVKNLHQIEQFYASSNQIEDISALQNLIALEILDLRANKISEIDALSGLGRLSHLHLESNQVKSIQPLKHLSQLIQLNLRHNEICNIDALLGFEKLTHLYLSDNQLNSLPEWILNFQLPIKWNSGGQGISVAGNPIKSPPPEVIQQGNTYIEQYFQKLAGQKKYSLNQLKLHLVGDAGVGKTSLARLLRGESFNEKEPQTQGIDIHVWKQNDININCWDFAGDEKFFALHHFFFSPRGLYVLVLDNREQRQEERWLKRIESIDANAPVLIVLNKFEQPQNHDLNRKALTRRFPNIVGFFPLSCIEGVGIENFKQVLISAFNRVESLKLEMTQSGLQVKKELEKKLFANYSDYIVLCQKYAINDKKTQKNLIRLLNDLGSIFYIQTAETNDKNCFLFNPRWIIQALYKILNSPKIIQQQAELMLDELSSILEVKTAHDFPYPNDKLPCIVELLKQLQLIYQIDNQKLFIPNSEKEPPEELEFDDNEALSFQIQYNYLDDSIMPRFQTKLYNEIDKKHYYQQQIFLTNPNLNSSASFLVDYQKDAVYIKTNGEKKRDYFYYLRDILYSVSD